MTTAIGVMARVPVSGACKTRLLTEHSGPWAAALQAAMLHDTCAALGTLRRAHATEVRLVVLVAPLGDGTEAVDPAVARIAEHVPRDPPWQVAVQRGEDLGARVESAFVELFARGVDRALLLGSDCPVLPLHAIREALARPSRSDGANRVLVGPSEDGGYYLIGLDRPDPRLFRGMPWSTPALLEATRVRAGELGLAVEELPRAYDVDEPADVRRLHRDLEREPGRAPATARHLLGRYLDTSGP